MWGKGQSDAPPISFSVYMLAAEYKSSPPTGARPMSPVRPGPRPRPLVQHVVDTANKITASGHSSFRSSHSPLGFFNFDIDTVMNMQYSEEGLCHL